MVKVGVIVPVLYNKIGCTELLSSVKTKHSWQPYIIDNWHKKWCVAKSWNEGISAAKQDGCDYVVVANDDILLSPTTIDNMIGYLNDDVIVVTATRVHQLEIGGEKEGILDYQTPADGLMPSPDFACWSAKSDILDVVGLCDENFRPAYFEDDDYVRRIILMGKRVHRSMGAPMWHDGSATQNWYDNIGECDHAHFEFNRDYYIRKWGLGPGFEKFDTPYNMGGSLKDWRFYPTYEEIGR